MMGTTIYSRISILSIAVFTWLSAHGMAVPQRVVPQPLATSLSEQLRGRLETLGHTTGTMIQNKIIRALDSLVRFYEGRSFRPVWICEVGPLPHTEALMQVIGQADREGIRAASFHLTKIAQLMVEQTLAHGQPLSQHLRSQIDLELLLTDAFFMHGSQMLSGQIDPR